MACDDDDKEGGRGSDGVGFVMGNWEIRLRRVFI